MFLSTAIDSGIGLTAGKKMCGKAIAQSDDNYLTTVNLRQKFIQLKKFLSIKEQPRLDIEKIEPLKNAINKLQSDLTEQKTITDVISEENQKIKKQLDEKGQEIKQMQQEVSKQLDAKDKEVTQIQQDLEQFKIVMQPLSQLQGKFQDSERLQLFLDLFEKAQKEQEQYREEELINFIKTRKLSNSNFQTVNISEHFIEELEAVLKSLRETKLKEEENAQSDSKK